MKGYNIIILIIFILLAGSIFGYFFYLDVIYEDKIMQKDVESLYKLKKAANSPILSYASGQELQEKADEYNEIIRELNLDAIAEIEGNIVVVKGAIGSSYAYVILKKFLDVVKNDEVNLINLCVGKGCTKENFGFLVKFRPYTLKLKK